ncbi:hypothetical protein JCM16303_004617, partial [Sporobolomyces ruberrimus]
MAFQAMMGGSECSTSQNPLSTLLKQQQTDRSLHQSGQLHPAQSGHVGGPSMRSSLHNGQLISQDEADRFLQMNPAGASGNSLEMAQMRRELENVAHRGHALKGDR